MNIFITKILTEYEYLIFLKQNIQVQIFDIPCFQKQILPNMNIKYICTKEQNICTQIFNAS